MLVRYKCAYAKKMQNRLRRVLVFDTSRAFSLPVQKRGLVVRRVLVFDTSGADFWLKNTLLRAACALSYIQEKITSDFPFRLWLLSHRKIQK